MPTPLTAAALARVEALLTVAHSLTEALEHLEQGLARELGVGVGPSADVITDAIHAHWTADRLCQQLGVEIEEE